MALPMLASVGLSLLPSLGGLFGGKDYQRPAGTIGTDQVLNLLKQGLSVDQIAGMGPMSSRFMANAQRKLTKAGLSAADIQKLRGGAFGPMSGLGGSPGPMGMDAFQSLMPSFAGNPAVFSNPAAAGWLSSLFAQAASPSGPVPVPPTPGPTPIPFNDRFSPWRDYNPKGVPGPAPNPTLGLAALAGPFGNGGGPMIPDMSSLAGKAGRGPFRF